MFVKPEVFEQLLGTRSPRLVRVGRFPSLARLEVGDVLFIQHDSPANERRRLKVEVLGTKSYDTVEDLLSQGAWEDLVPRRFTRNETREQLARLIRHHQGVGLIVIELRKLGISNEQ